MITHQDGDETLSSQMLTTLQLSNHLQVKIRLAGDSVATVQFKYTLKISPFLNWVVGLSSFGCFPPKRHGYER